jgi:hypothetical protein
MKSTKVQLRVCTYHKLKLKNNHKTYYCIIRSQKNTSYRTSTIFAHNITDQSQNKAPFLQIESTLKFGGTVGTGKSVN